MPAFQAVTDDSAAESGDRRLFLAGYLLPTKSWVEFSKAWNLALRRSPSIHHLKMVEAQNLRGEFRHWNVEQKNKKLNQLANVIRKFTPASFQFSTSRLAFDKFYKPVAPYGLGRPHFTCTFGVVSMVTQFLATAGLSDVRVQFIFDRQDGVSTDMNLFFEYMSENLPSNQSQIVEGVPCYLDDDEFMPLQAADMLAWHLRREHEDGTLTSSPIMRQLRGDAHYTMQLEADMLIRWAKHHAEQPQVPKTKSEWKRGLEEARMLMATDFKPPHGDWKEIYEARAKHLYQLYKDE